MILIKPLDVIKNKLCEIESLQGIRILLAVESGSRAWGFDSEDSDYDVRFIYIRPTAWYLSVQKRRDVIEIPIDSDLDFSGWDLQKALYLMGKCNPVLFEWLRSPITYFETPESELLKEASKRFFQPKTAMYHYLHMADGNFREYLKGETVRLKKYLYVLRPLLACKWIEKQHCPPPMEMEILINDAENIPRDEIDKLVAAKKEGQELSEGPRIELLNKFIEREIAKYSELVRVLPKQQVSYDELDEIFFRLVWRKQWEQINLATG